MSRKGRPGRGKEGTKAVKNGGHRAGKYQALILAAGESTRTRPLTTHMPKPMLPVAGRPLIRNIVENLVAEGICQIVIVRGHQGREVMECLERWRKATKGGEDLEITFIEQIERKGTAHAIGVAAGRFNAPFLCINGDIVVSRGQISGLLWAHEGSGNHVVGLHEVPDPARYGIVQLDDEGSVKRIIEKPAKPPSRLANTGLYLFKPSIFDTIEKTPLSPRGEFEITETINMTVGAGDTVRGFMFPKEEPYLDISVPWDLLRANELLMAGMAASKKDIMGTMEKHVTLDGCIRLGSGSVLRSGTYINGNVVIGEDCDIGPNCYLRGFTTIGDRCHVGAGVEIKNSIIMDGTKVPHLTYVGDSVIARDCNLGAGTQVANLRLDGKNVITYVKGMKADSGRRKLGVIMGQGVRTGVNATIMPGTVVGANAYIGAGAKAKGWIEEGARIY